MKKVVFIMLILIIVAINITTIFAESIVNDADFDNWKELDKIEIPLDMTYSTLRLMELDAPLTVIGCGDVETIIIRLLSKSVDSLTLQHSNENFSEEIWLNVDWYNSSLEDKSSSAPRDISDNSDIMIEIMLPKHMNLVLGESFGSVNISGIAGLDMNAGVGDLLLSNINGLVRVRDNAGPLTLKDVIGDVWISDLGGNIVVENVTGLVNVDSDVLLTLKIQDIKGDVTILSKLGGFAEVHNVDGNVSVFSRAPIKTACGSISGNLIVPED